MFPLEKVTAGNKDRSGQAGASELLINPWARSTGWGGVGTSCTQGLEGLVHQYCRYRIHKRNGDHFLLYQLVKGSGISIYNFGLSQKLGKNSGVLTVVIHVDELR